MAKLIKDVFGHEIIVNQTILDFSEKLVQSDEVFDGIAMVIEKPIMIFKMNEGLIQLYYLRAIGWNKTMLIGVQKKGDHFEVINYQLDPDIERITELHRKGERLIW